jgi:predicted MPP superfamily phosphohydrolase
MSDSVRPVLRAARASVALGVATLAYAGLVERNLFTLRRFTVPVLPSGAAPLRILHVSDAHFTPGQHHKQRWISRLARTEPDFVVLTGDSLASVNAVPIALRAYGPLLELPGAFVFGSNDYYGPVLKNPFGYLRPQRRSRLGAPLPAAELRAALSGAGWEDLTNAQATIKVGERVVDVIGVDDPHLSRDDYVTARADRPADGEADLRLGLLHSPEPRVLDAMSADGCQLLMAGHTHGGQVCVPGMGALTTNCGLDRRMAKGLHRWGSDSYLHVSAGLGTHPTAPIRFGCPPEASILTLTSG